MQIYTQLRFESQGIPFIANEFSSPFNQLIWNCYKRITKEEKINARKISCILNQSKIGGHKLVDILTVNFDDTYCKST